MTAIAMLLGTMPMALALEEGSEMTRAAGPGRHRRGRGLDLRRAADLTGHVRLGDGQLEEGFAVD